MTHKPTSSIPVVGRRSSVVARSHAQLLAPSALFLVTLGLYLATLTQVHTFDALSYVTSVEHKPWTEVFHPHHLAYGPLGVLALAAGRALGFAGGAALPMQLVNACAGALGVALFFASVRRITRRADAALVAALLLGGAYACWYYAVEIEVYTVATLFLIICLDLLARIIKRPTRARWLLLGLAQGGAVLFHQTNLLFCAPVLLVAWGVRGQGTGDRGQGTGDRNSGDRRQGSGDRGQETGVRRQGSGDRGQGSETQNSKLKTQNLRGPVAYALVLGLTVGLPYLLVGWVSGFRSAGDFMAWMTEYARTGWWGGAITASTWARLATGLTETLAQPGGALLGLLLVGLLVLHARHLLRAPRPLLAALIAWLLVYGAFFFWWEADNIEFWIASLPPAALLLALALTGTRRWGPDIIIALAVVAVALGVNGDAIARRGDAHNDLQRVIARALAAQSTPADLLLVPDGLLELYLPYYEGHDNFLSLNQALFDNGDRWPQACAAVRARIEAALHAGATALIADETLRPPELLRARHHLAQAQVDACFAPYRPALLPISMPAAAPAYWRLPTGQARAEGAGWRFDDAPNGWQAANVRDQRFARGWVFTPERDPSLTSPLMQLDTRRYRALEIRLANGTRARDAQLFFAGPDGVIREDRSLRWALKPTAEAVTYRLDLHNAPGWQGVITRLRLDPVGVGDGGALRLESVQLIER